MILYNVTLCVDADVAAEWLVWMRNKHIPDVMATGLFVSSRICRIKGHEEGGLSYSVQYVCTDEGAYRRYQEEFAAALQKEHSERYSGKFAAFRTELEILEEWSAQSPSHGTA
jgi:hypothetical protein